MYTIDEKTHIASTLASLDKIYNNAKINGSLNPENIYILNIVYKLINKYQYILTPIQYKILLSKYYKILDSNVNISKVLACNTPQPQIKSKFIQSEINDCNEYTRLSKIFYWQEEDYTTTVEDVFNLFGNIDFLKTNPSDTKLIFESGKNINYLNIGRIVFAITDVNFSDDYRIYDILNNDVTSSFTRFYIDIQNTILFVSNNIYSHGLMNIKIKQIGTDYSIFNNIFNNNFR